MPSDAAAPARVYDLDVRAIDGTPVRLDRYRGHVLLVVNVASRCGYTPQYRGLEALHRRFSARGFAVLGFPCDQFGGQEPGTNAEIAEFCTRQYGVTFPMFEKIEVNGPRAHPLFAFLKSRKKGVLGSESIKWNFTKFLIGRDGEVLRRFGTAETPDAIADAIDRALGA